MTKLKLHPFQNPLKTERVIHLYNLFMFRRGWIPAHHRDPLVLFFYRLISIIGCYFKHSKTLSVSKSITVLSTPINVECSDYMDNTYGFVDSLLVVVSLPLTSAGYDWRPLAPDLQQEAESRLTKSSYSGDIQSNLFTSGISKPLPVWLHIDIQ